MSMDFGLVLPNLGPLATPEAVLAIAEAAEAAGFADLWTSDHVVLPIESDTSYPYVRAANVRLDPHYPIVDPIVALSGIATRTERIGLGISVYLAALRHPIVAARLVASLDRLSQGRVRLGVGAGWIPEEYAALGIDFSQRGRVLDEHLACMRALWTQDRPEFSGEHYCLANIAFEPKPVQTRLPIFVGGNSAAARERAVRLGDGWHVIDVPLPELAESVRALHASCRDAGRDPNELTVSMRAQVVISETTPSEAERFAPLVGTRAAILEDLERMREIGVNHVVLWPGGRDHDLESYLACIDRFAAEILPPFSQVDAPNHSGETAIRHAAGSTHASGANESS